MMISLNIPAIKKLMGEKRMTATKLSRLSGISRQAISVMMYRGTAKPDTAALIADALGVEIEEIWKEGA